MARTVKDLEQEQKTFDKIVKFRKSKKYKKIREDLMNQLIKTGANTPAFENMVETYMGFMEQAEICREDIAERGLYIEYNNGGGQTGVTDNPSIDKMAKANTQMIKILSYLKISVQQTTVGETDDEL